jgi:bifunctional DNase/RNase
MTVPTPSSAWADLFVAEVRRSAADDPALQAHVMVLAERNGSRQLPIWVGPAEAIAVALSLESQESPRPLTYQMAGRLLQVSGARASEVRITRLTNEVFYASIILDGPAGRLEVDAKPSDALLVGQPHFRV